jgi:integrase
MAVLTATLKAVKMEAATDGLAFLTPQGTPYRNLRTAFEGAVQQAGLEDFTFHDLRHTFASRLVMAGVDLPTVKELLGHKGIAMTLHYTHLSTDHQQRAVHALEQFGEQVSAIFTTVRERHTGNLP